MHVFKIYVIAIFRDCAFLCFPGAIEGDEKSPYIGVQVLSYIGPHNIIDFMLYDSHYVYLPFGEGLEK